MTKEEIVEGLRQAVSKGEPLEKALTSFFNAGYSKEDIEEAASVLQMPTTYQPQPQFQQPQQKIPSPMTAQTVVQRVSEYGNYGKKPSRTGTAITFILFALLLLSFGVLAAVIFFKEEISLFFSNLFFRALF